MTTGVRAAAALMLWSGLVGMALEARGQTLGEFRWRLEPFCNVLTFVVTGGGSGFTLSGFDDQCGGVARAPVAGAATTNANGTFALGFVVVELDGQTSHTVATLNPVTLTGPWQDSSGNTGTFRFNPPGGTIGPPRPAPALVPGSVTSVALAPGAVTTQTLAAGAVDSSKIADGTIGLVDVNTTEIQQRITGVCAAGETILGVNANGTVICGLPAPGGAAPGTENTAVGAGALAVNTGAGNTAVGSAALGSNTAGASNTAVGANALDSNTIGIENTAVGQNALTANVNGVRNVAVGSGALSTNIAGSDNIAVGRNALSATTGVNNIAVGTSAGFSHVTGNNNIYIASAGVPAETGRVRIGTSPTQAATFIAGISAVNVGAQPAVLVSAAGQLGINASSARFKESIEPMGDASHGLLALRPVTFRYRDAPPGAPREYGLIAEEVATVYPDLVHPGPDGKPLTVLYHVLPVLLVNELQRQEGQLATLRAQLGLLRARLDALERERELGARSDW